MPIPDLVCVFVHKSENYLFSFHCRVIREQRLFHLHGHTQNSGLVNLIPESRLPLVPISTFPLTEKWPRRPEIGIKDDCFKEMEQEYMYSIPKKKKNRTIFSDVQLLLQIFRWIEPKTRVSDLLSIQICWYLLVNGKNQQLYTCSTLFCTIYLPSMHDRYEVKAPKQTKSLVY